MPCHPGSWSLLGNVAGGAEGLSPPLPDPRVLGDPPKPETRLLEGPGGRARLDSTHPVVLHYSFCICNAASFFSWGLENSLRGSKSGLFFYSLPKRPKYIQDTWLLPEALPTTIARIRFPQVPQQSLGECDISEASQALPSRPRVGGPLGAPSRAGGYDTALGLSALGLRLQTLLRAWLSARPVWWASRSVAGTQELALSCPFVRG